MKLVALLLLSLPVLGQMNAYSISTEPPPAPEYKLPKFLLVTRYYSSVCYSNLIYPPGPATCVGWGYNYSTFDTLADLLKDLNTRYGRWSNLNIVGVFRLDDKSEVKIITKKVQHVIPKHVNEEKWEETEFSVEAAKP